MPVTPLDTVLHKVMNAIQAKLAALVDGAGGPAIFTAARVFFQGDVENLSAMPVAVVEFVDERSEGQDQPLTKIGSWMPWTLEVQFDTQSPGATLRQRHTHIRARVQDAFMLDRTLGGTAIDTRYLGGGGALEAADVENQPDRWRFTLRFETHYRHKDTDSSVAA